MSSSATFEDIVECLAGFSAASPSWAEGLYTARLSLDAVETFVATMTQDFQSPLRLGEEGLMSQEISRINRERGAPGAGGEKVMQTILKVRNVLSPAEQTRVVRLVGGFCQPSFETGKKFSSSGHSVMNAVRRVLTSYLTQKVPKGGSVLEVGPDVKNWILSPTPSAWSTDSAQYKGARPTITPRDTVRMRWEDLAKRVLDTRGAFYSEDVRQKAQVLRDRYADVFEDKKIQNTSFTGEYILSFDSNYDIAFSDMPVAMGACGARAWYGTLVRAKGLTSTTRLREGKLDLMGVTYRVDWQKSRIDFRHPGCSAFGYSHNVWEYMKYEEHNGFVWTTSDCHYVYSKGPETTDEILFFQVVRVPKLHRMVEPRFVEHPQAGQVEINSIWATGDEVDGVPRSFAQVKYCVDALNFSKILEKRRALDYKGDLGKTVSLVRSTNVRFWLHGTPVGVSKKIEARLADATAVAVEALVHEQRLCDNRVFKSAMYQYDLSVASSDWLRDLVVATFDMRAAMGLISAPIMRIWQGVRATLVDKAVSPLRSVRVSASVVGGHVRLDACEDESVDSGGFKSTLSLCKCGEIADLNVAIAHSSGSDRKLLEAYLEEKLRDNRCNLCGLDLEVVADDCDEFFDACSDHDSGFVSGSSDLDSSDVSVGSDKDSQKVLFELGDSWLDVDCQQRVEAKAMDEFVMLEEYIAHAQLVECRIDSARIFKAGPITDVALRDASTTRTKHAVLEFLSGRCVKRYGHKEAGFSAVFDHRKDEIVSVRTERSVMFAAVPDGFYYTSNRLKVWNGPELVAAANYARSYGCVRDFRRGYDVTLGVPGAGKTYGMMKQIAAEYARGSEDFLVLAITNKSADQARAYGVKFGIDESLLEGRVMTLDRYLIHGKFPASVLCVDEFPMVHVGKVDAAASIAAARTVRLYGDARQIPYDPFCAELPLHFSTLGSSVSEDRVSFLPETHRLRIDTCAMWLDQYPSIYPCSCCRVDQRDGDSLRYERVHGVEHVRYDGVTRFHTYKQDEKEELKGIIGAKGDTQSLRDVREGGLATVHEDQGTTHSSVVTVRLHADFDKNASPRNPSLYNRERYVLTDTTRHTDSYVYYTLSEERDVVIQRIEMSKDPYRRALVSAHKGLGGVSVMDML